MLHARRFFFLIAVLSLTSRAPGQEFVLLPGGTAVRPLLAAPREARTGLIKEFGSSRMRLDIGTVVDLAAYRPAAGWDIRFGADIFAYGLTTSSEGLRLQVDAIDGFFGGHLSVGRGALALRLRILHHSAHFVDGHYDLNRDEWKGQEPTPYTRDAGELLVRAALGVGPVEGRVYAGAEYATFMRPDAMRRWSVLGGLEARTLAGRELLGQPLWLYLAYHLGVDGVPEYETTHTVQAGMRFGAWNGAGLRILVEYASGLEPYGQYYTVRSERWGAGFALDLW